MRDSNARFVLGAPVEGTARVTIGELDGWLRSMTTMGPVVDAVVRRSSSRTGRSCGDRAELKRQLEQLGPAWAEPRTVLNELNRVLGDT